MKPFNKLFFAIGARIGSRIIIASIYLTQTAHRFYCSRATSIQRNRCYSEGALRRAQGKQPNLQDIVDRDIAGSLQEYRGHQRNSTTRRPISVIATTKARKSLTAIVSRNSLPGKESDHRYVVSNRVYLIGIAISVNETEEAAYFFVELSILRNNPQK